MWKWNLFRIHLFHCWNAPHCWSALVIAAVDSLFICIICIYKILWLLSCTLRIQLYIDIYRHYGWLAFRDNIKILVSYVPRIQKRSHACTIHSMRYLYRTILLFYIRIIIIIIIYVISLLNNILFFIPNTWEERKRE